VLQMSPFAGAVAATPWAFEAAKAVAATTGIDSVLIYLTSGSDIPFYLLVRHTHEEGPAIQRWREAYRLSVRSISEAPNDRRTICLIVHKKSLESTPVK
jgi:hypothetical protein